MRIAGLAFLLGIFGASYLPVMPGYEWSLLLFLILPAIWYGKRFEWLRSLVIAITGGLWFITYVTLFTPAPLPAAMDGQTISVTGQIVSIPRHNLQRDRFDFQVEQVHGLQTAWLGKVRLGWYHSKHALQAGQIWRLQIKLKPAHGFANPGGFDYEGSLFRQAIGATGYVRNPGSAKLVSSSTTLHSWRQTISNGIQQAVAGSPYVGLLVALTTGDKQFIDHRQWQVMTRTGTVHLMAISGLHIGLVYGLFFWLGRRLWRLSGRLCLYRPAQDVAVIVGLSAAVVYAAMAGFSIPTQRALIMLAVVGVAVLSRRLTAPLDVLQAALLLVLLFDPLAVLSAGFWLSFAAVAVIFLTLDREDKDVPAWYRLLRIQWVIALGLLPLTSLFFYQVSIVAPVMNLLAVPWVGLAVVPLALIGAVLTLVSPTLAQWVLGLADQLLQLLWLLLEPASDSSYAVIHPAQPALWVILCVLAGLMLVLLNRKTGYRLAGLVMMSPLFLSAASPVKQYAFQVDFLDVGQGTAVVVRTAEHTLVYDTGFSNDSGFDIGQRVILPYIWHEGIKQLDKVILSHDDRDHIGGYASIRDEIAVQQLIVMPGSRFLQESPGSTACRAGDHWQWDGVDFRFLHPQADAAGKENNRSCVLKISGKGGSVLLAGDIERSAEQALLAGMEGQVAADILLSPHHGSATSSSMAFIKRVSPAEVVHSAGYRNRFGFPKQQVSERYAKIGVQQWNTAETGMLRYRFGQTSATWQVSPYRQRNSRFWQAGADR